MWVENIRTSDRMTSASAINGIGWMENKPIVLHWDGDKFSPIEAINDRLVVLYLNYLKYDTY